MSNIKPKTIFTGDNLPIMRGINSDSIDLIYLDPPFNSNANYAAPIGSEAAGTEFKDTWSLQDVDVAWLDLIEIEHPNLNRVIHAAMTDSDKSYLIYMAVRLLEMHRILKPTGSIYLHCDPTMSHYIKLMLDAIFGRYNFLNEITWHYGKWTNAARHFQRNHDTILFYTKSKNYTFNNIIVDRRNTAPYNIQGGKVNQLLIYNPEQTPKKVIDDAKAKGRKIIHVPQKGINEHDTWTYIRDKKMDYLAPRSKERTGYRTQKPLALLDRIIKASSNEGDLVLDPFCGCATTCVAADRLQRNWIGIDCETKAAELVVKRIKDDQGLFQDILHRTDIPKRTDLGDIPKYNCAENRTKLYGKQKGDCNGCGTHFEARHLEVDHIIAESVGGTDHIENLQLLCSHCNRIKGDRGQEYLLMRLNPQPQRRGNIR